MEIIPGDIYISDRLFLLLHGDRKRISHFIKGSYQRILSTGVIACSPVRYLVLLIQSQTVSVIPCILCIVPCISDIGKIIFSIGLLRQYPEIRVQFMHPACRFLALFRSTVTVPKTLARNRLLCSFIRAPRQRHAAHFQIRQQICFCDLCLIVSGRKIHIVGHGDICYNILSFPDQLS